MEEDNFLDVFKMAIPIYGDFYIHRFFSEERKKSKEELKRWRKENKRLEKEEDKFKEKLSIMKENLMKDYNIKEEMGSLVSFPPVYVSREKMNLLDWVESGVLDLIIGTTIIPEAVIYCAKYAAIFAAGYELIHGFDNFRWINDYNPPPYPRL